MLGVFSKIMREITLNFQPQIRGQNKSCDRGLSALQYSGRKGGTGGISLQTRGLNLLVLFLYRYSLFHPLMRLCLNLTTALL
jgi:hypothetical protein